METKICSKCNQELPIDNFYWRNKAKGIRRADCKNCHNKYVKEKNQEKKDEIQEIKSKCKCEKCGDSRGYVLDFHHIDPKTKIDTIARLTSSNRNKEIVQKEIEKCIVLCSNCHREYHYLQKRNEDLDIETYIADYCNG